MLLDREVCTTRKSKCKTGQTEKDSSPGAKRGRGIQEGEETSEDKETIDGMTQSEWRKLTSEAMHHGYNPEQQTFELLQGEGNPFPHPMQLPTKSANLNGIMAILKDSKYRPAKTLWRQRTAEHLNINDLIRKLDQRFDKPKKIHSGLTFFPGNSDALQVKLPKAKEFFFLIQLTSECFFVWTFAPCSRTVKGFVESMAKKPQVEARIRQLLGFVPEFDDLVGGRLLHIISVYAWLEISFEDLWVLLESTMDPATNIKPSAKVQWRSRFADRQLSAFEGITLAVYHIERIIYTNPPTSVEDKLRYELDTIDNLCQNIESAIMGAFPRQLAIGRCEDQMEIRIKQKFRDMVKKTREEGQFSPYRYFLGKHPAGTGETYILKTYPIYICLLLLSHREIAFSNLYYYTLHGLTPLCWYRKPITCYENRVGNAIPYRQLSRPFK
jgi:hypothetical protein